MEDTLSKLTIADNGNDDEDASEKKQEELSNNSPPDLKDEDVAADDHEPLQLDNDSSFSNGAFPSVDDIEPVDPWDENNLVQEPLFSEEDFVSVLRSFDDNHSDEEAEDAAALDLPAEGDVLPDLDLDIDQGDDSLLLPPEELSSIFGQHRSQDEHKSSDEESQNEKEQGDEVLRSVIQTQSNEKSADEIYASAEDLGLLNDLKNLNLDWQLEEEEYYEALPPYMYCQPCTPTAQQQQQQTSNYSLASTAEEEGLTSPSANFRRYDDDRPKLPEKEFDTYLQFSMLNIEEDGANPYLTEEEMDSLFQAGHDGPNEHVQYAQEESQHHPQQQQQGERAPAGHSQQVDFHVSQRPEALEAAAEFISSFEAGASGLKNERSCLGHKETIFGTSFSECGKYLATASQDSTVRIWNVEKNSCIATLSEHSKDYECLRAAWYVSCCILLQVRLVSF